MCMARKTQPPLAPLPVAVLTRADVLRVAGEAECDPRTVVQELAAQRGERKPVRGMVGERIRKALAKGGES